VTDHDFDASIVQKTGHRPWAMPGGPWVMTQTWHDLLFAHWLMDPAHLRAKVPHEFELDLFDNSAWLGIVPFHMTNVAPRGVPSMPWISAFPELNVRTYVRVGDRPGIYFFSLDAGSSIAVKAARAVLNLPYYSASMSVSTVGNEVEYRSARGSDGSADFNATYEPVGTPFVAAEGTLEYFLTERYCLYHHDHGGAPYRLEIHHPPWSLQVAKATLGRNTMATANGLSVAGAPTMLHFARRQDAIAWMPWRLGG
jgi:uncharacterized protein YqjF (DUF2071 family)